MAKHIGPIDPFLPLLLIGGGVLLYFNWPKKNIPIVQGKITLPPNLAKKYLPPSSNRNTKPYIQWLQLSLNKILGSNLDVDGDYGPLTTAEVKIFQQISAINDDGIIGPITERYIIEALQQGLDYGSGF